MGRPRLVYFYQAVMIIYMFMLLVLAVIVKDYGLSPEIIHRWREQLKNELA